MKVLIAEDDNLIRKTIEIKLAKEATKSYPVPKARPRWIPSRTEQPDVVLTDIVLPAVSGLEIVSAVKQSGGKQMKVIVLSTMGQENIVEEAFKLGADDYMTKPFSLTELSIRVKRSRIPNNNFDQTYYHT